MSVVDGVTLVATTSLKVLQEGHSYNDLLQIAHMLHGSWSAWPFFPPHKHAFLLCCVTKAHFVGTISWSRPRWCFMFTLLPRCSGGPACHGVPSAASNPYVFQGLVGSGTGRERKVWFHRPLHRPEEVLQFKKDGQFLDPTIGFFPFQGVAVL